jgi:hypothetical protein
MKHMTVLDKYDTVLGRNRCQGTLKELQGCPDINLTKACYLTKGIDKFGRTPDGPNMKNINGLGTCPDVNLSARPTLFKRTEHDKRIPCDLDSGKIASHTYAPAPQPLCEARQPQRSVSSDGEGDDAPRTPEQTLEDALQSLRRANMATRLQFDWKAHCGAVEDLKQLLRGPSDEVFALVGTRRREILREAVPGVAGLRGCTVQACLELLHVRYQLIIVQNY